MSAHTIQSTDPSDGVPTVPTEFVRAGDDLLLAAVERLVGGSRQRALRFLDHVTSRGTPMDHLWCALDRDGRVIASALAIPNPGRTAMIFVSPPAKATRDRSVALTAHLCETMARHGSALAQALLPEDAHAERAVLHDAGFRDLTVLISMERPLPRRGDINVPAAPVGASIEPWDQDDRRTMIDVLEATYEQTLDCPGLCGLRRTEDILDGHLHSGRVERLLWSLLRLEGVVVGAALLSPSGADSVELVYLGLARRARGRGLGHFFSRAALASLAGRRERYVGLAVDCANEPALRLYRSLGFRPVHRRQALIRPL